jgi:hypothetical protein
LGLVGSVRLKFAGTKDGVREVQGHEETARTAPQQKALGSLGRSGSGRVAPARLRLVRHHVGGDR